MEKPIIKKLREFNNGFEHYTFETSQYYAQECIDLDDLAVSIDDNLTIAKRDWDTLQAWEYDANNDIVLYTLPEDEGGKPDPFLKIVVPDDWK